MSGLCKDCKYWGGYGAAGEEPEPGWRACHLTDSSGGRKTVAESKAVAIDFEHYAADLFTAPDFACNQFEAREGSVNLSDYPVAFTEPEVVGDRLVQHAIYEDGRREEWHK